MPCPPGGPCPQPRQLTTNGLPPCVSLTVIDYFEGSGAGYGLIIVTLCCFPLGGLLLPSVLCFPETPQAAPYLPA